MDRLTSKPSGNIVQCTSGKQTTRLHHFQKPQSSQKQPLRKCQSRKIQVRLDYIYSITSVQVFAYQYMVRSRLARYDFYNMIFWCIGQGIRSSYASHDYTWITGGGKGISTCLKISPILSVFETWQQVYNGCTLTLQTLYRVYNPVGLYTLVCRIGLFNNGVYTMKNNYKSSNDVARYTLMIICLLILVIVVSTIFQYVDDPLTSLYIALQ